MGGFLDQVTTIKGRFVELRPVSGEDFPTLYRWRSSFDHIHYLNFRRTVGSYESFVRDVEAILPTSLFLLIRDCRTKEPIGYAIGYNINSWDRYMGASIFIEPSRRLRVYGGEAMVRALDFAFSVYPLDRVIVETYEFATQLGEMLDRMGFEEVGMIGSHFWWNGRKWGLQTREMTREQWEDARRRFLSLIDSDHFLEHATQTQEIPATG
jgi:RimJ/RimL family protein N-acetyltransferase